MKRRSRILSTGLFICLFVLLSMNMAAHAATTITWDNGAGDGDWNNGINWSGDTVPANSSSYYAAVQMTAGPVVTTAETVNAYRILVNGSNGTLTINGGTINVGNHFYVADTSTAVGTLNVNGGAINITGTLYIGRDAGSVGNVNLLGGSITCATLSLRFSGGTGNINIEAGTLTFTSSASPVATYIANGWIKAYNGAGTVLVDTTTMPGKTILSAQFQTKAANPLPANSAKGVSTTVDLSWRTLPGTTSHDVYFGTSLSDVANTARLNGDLDGDKTSGWEDLSVLSQYWLMNPTGSNPFVDLNNDNTVDLMDYSMIAPDWKNSANPVFKGNQDSNSFDPGTLTQGVTYFWRVDEVSDSGIITGDLWSFTTTSGTMKFVLIGDTQKIVNEAPTTFPPAMQWLADNAASQGISFVLQMGDNTEDSFASNWDTVQTAWYQLDVKVPYVLNIGNNDVINDSTANNFNEHFPLSRYQVWPSFVSNDDRHNNVAHQFLAGGVNWLVISIMVNPSTAYLNWAENLVASNPDKKVILISHDANPTSNVSSMGQRHANVVFVLCGHVNPPMHQLLTANDGHQIGYVRTCHHNKNLDSYFCFVELDPSAGTASFRFYSPQYGKYWDDPSAPYYTPDSPWQWSGFNFVNAN